MTETSALITDFYELTMMHGYYLENHDSRAVFDMFYRTNPYQGGYTIFTGIEELIDKLEGLRFSESDISYLRSLSIFDEGFLDYLRTYRFHGNVYAFDEGTPAFPGEPLIRVESDLMDAQLVETLILNTVNFETLIATKASRMSLATKGHGNIMEFGLRRAQGENGAHSASRASFIGGTKSTSNTFAGKKFGIPVAGTMAHSWIMSYPSEEEAFRKFVEIYPDNGILLIDTYDTLGSGIEAAIKIGLEQKAKGKRIGVRIDSGDLSYLTKEIRARLVEDGPYDAIISDAAPMTTGNRIVDTTRSEYLAEQVVMLAEEQLKEHGNMVIKIFQGGGEQEVLKKMRTIFSKAKAFKPKASRDDSFEIFLIGLDRKPRES